MPSVTLQFKYVYLLADYIHHVSLKTTFIYEYAPVLCVADSHDVSLPHIGWVSTYAGLMPLTLGLLGVFHHHIQEGGGGGGKKKINFFKI